jgi:hypothetical protein
MRRPLSVRRMAISIPFECRKFRVAVIPMSLFIFFSGVVLFLILIVITEGFHINWGALTFASGFAFVFPIAYSWMLSLLLPSAFSADGIYGHSFWGPRRFVRWQDIASVRTFRLVNLLWLRIYATDGTVTWLPLFQSRSQEFRQEIQRLAALNSPVLNYI